MHVHLPLTGRYVGSCFKQGAVMAWGFTANTFLKFLLAKAQSNHALQPF